jgi:nucleoside-diphosphate-sugar epimerase
MSEVSEVVVSGATSQIGYYLLPRLAALGHRVHAISRHPPSGEHWQRPGILWHQLNFTEGSFALLVGQAHSLIHLAPLWTLPSVIGAFKDLGVERSIVFSSTSRFTKLDSQDLEEQALARHLAEAEENLQQYCGEHGLNLTIFRPTLVYSAGLDRNLSTLARFILRFGFLPIPGEGRGRRQPVHANDLAAACVSALNNPATFHKVYNLSGGTTLTYRAMTEAIFTGLQMRPWVIPIPTRLYRVLIRLISLLPTYRHLSAQMVSRVNEDLCFDYSAATRDFGFAPRKFVYEDPRK